MMTFVAVLHILVALLLIGLVLVQDSKGGGALGMGGGGSNSVLGAAGAQTIWAKITRIIAFIFAITCISLTYMSALKTKSIMDSTPVPPVAPAATTPATAPGTPTATSGAAAVPTAPETQEAPAAPTEKAALPVETPQADAPKK